MAFSPDGQLVAARSDDSMLWCWTRRWVLTITCSRANCARSGLMRRFCILFAIAIAFAAAFWWEVRKHEVDIFQSDGMEYV